MSREQSPASPRVVSLRNHIERTGAVAINSFWREVADQGTPLIEPDGDDPASRLVTFVWRAEGDLANVVLISEHLNGWWWNGFASSKLDRLSDTDLWYRT